MAQAHKPWTGLQHGDRFVDTVGLSFGWGMATGELGFATVLQEANRRGTGRQAAHAAVMDLRALARQPAQAALAVVSVVVSDDKQQHPPG